MVEYAAYCALPTDTDTRIYTFISDTRSRRWTVVTEDTLRSATGVRISGVLWQAIANSVVALRVGSAGCAGIGFDWATYDSAALTGAKVTVHEF